MDGIKKLGAWLSGSSTSSMRSRSRSRSRSQSRGRSASVDRWLPLRPWCDMLRGRVSVHFIPDPSLAALPSRARFGAPQLTLNGDVADLSAKEQARLREAIELVSLALLLAPSAWEEVLGVMCEVGVFRVGRYRHDDLVAQMSLCLRCHRSVTTSDDMSFVESVWVDAWSAHFSKKFHRTHQWLVTTFCPQMQYAMVSRRQNIPVRLHFQQTFRSEAPCLAYCERVLALAERLERNQRKQQQAQDSGMRVLSSSSSSSSSPASPAASPVSSPSAAATKLTVSILRLEAMELTLVTERLTPRVAAVMHRMTQAGITINKLVMNPCDPRGTLDHLLPKLMTNQLESLVLHDFPTAPLSTVCATLRNSRTIHHVEIHGLAGNDSCRRVKASWIAYAFLHPSSPTSVKSLCLTGVSRATMENMIELMQAEDSMALLEQVGASCPWQSAPAIACEQVRESTCERGTPHQLHALKLFPLRSQNESDMQVVIDLLSSTGGNLESLVLSFEMEHLHERWQHGELTEPRLRLLLAACPVLRVLRLRRIQLQSLDVFVRAYADEICRLETLCLDDVAVDAQWSVLNLIKVADDPANFAHRWFRNFVYASSLHVAIVRSVPAALSTNSTLHSINLQLPPQSMAYYMPMFHPHHLKELSVRRQPLSCREQLAFLSVIRRRARMSAQTSGENADTYKRCGSSLDNLNQDIARIIFDFAAACVQRQVLCHTNPRQRIP